MRILLAVFAALRAALPVFAAEPAAPRIVEAASLRKIESGAIVAEDFDGPRLDTSRWRVWQEEPQKTSVRQEDGRLTMEGRGRVGRYPDDVYEVVLADAIERNDSASSHPEGYYVFSYFLNNGEDGLHLATSRDGLAWRPVAGGRSLLKPVIGREKLVRDPSVVRGPDGVFHMVWTASWQDRVIGYAHSKDLRTWSAQKALGVMEHEPAARNCWAPELFYDPAERQYVILWSTTIPGRFPATEGASEDRYNHRIYATTTRDFQSFSRTQVLFEPGHSVIDAFLATEGGKYLLFYKDETRFPEAKKILLLATADRALGPYRPAGVRVSPHSWVEGPSALKLGAEWIVYFDRYTKNCYGASASRDLKNWTDIGDRLRFPVGARHGTVFRIDRATFDGLEKLK